MEKLEPLFDRVLLENVVEQQTESGIIIPRGGADRSHVMRVSALGQCKSALQIGDRVMVAKYAGTEVVFSGEKYLLVCEYDILGRFS